jgi:hypothetical protein
MEEILTYINCDFLTCAIWEKQDDNIYTWPERFRNPVPNFQSRKINNFPGVVSSRGTCFAFTTFHYDAPFERNRVGRTDGRTLTIIL